MDTTRFQIGGETRNALDATSRQIANRIYEGVDLEALHAAEINAPPFNGDVWAWVRARHRARNYRGINIGDFISFEVEGMLSDSGATLAIRATLAGINIYDTSGMDFINTAPFHVMRQWNLVNYNNGLGLPGGSSWAAENVPWIMSDIRAWLNGLQMDVPNSTGANPPTTTVDYAETGLWPHLPATLRAVIVVKMHHSLGSRFSPGILLTENNSFSITGDDRLWLPSEVEILGTPVLGDAQWGMQNHVQYPLFNSRSALRQRWADIWTLTPVRGNSQEIVSINGNGVPLARPAADRLRPLICFRIA